MTTLAEPSAPSGSPPQLQRRRQITSYKNTTTSPATDRLETGTIMDVSDLTAPAVNQAIEEFEQLKRKAS
jgi:hypothetical protein